jgi:glycine/D-amino acid oxidase-like deaminating enzyme
MKSDVKTDVLIIGGGMAGILCTQRLRRAGVNCLLVEADCIGGGVTQNTTAKITLQHGLLYDTMIRRFGVETAQMYVEAQRDAREVYRTTCQRVDCDYEECDSYVYARDPKGRQRIEREVAALRRLGCEAEFSEQLSLPFPVLGAVRLKGQAQFHPLNFLYAMSRDLPICEHTKVLELTPDGVLTNRGKIAAKTVIVATHFPFINKHGSYFLKLYQHRSYVLALENASVPDGMYVDESDTGLSFRMYDGKLLLGGGGHRTGKKGGGWNELREFAARHYPHSREVAHWATQDCVTLDGIPYIGRYSKRTADLYVATGFNKWGMTSSMVAATILCDLVQGKENPYAAVFSPSRSILRPQLAINTAGSLVGLLTPTTPRCPHLGCALKYNKQEHSWDCPCHGSRFSEKGNLLNNPATDDKPLT